MNKEIKKWNNKLEINQGKVNLKRYDEIKTSFITDVIKVIDKYNLGKIDIINSLRNLSDFMAFKKYNLVMRNNSWNVLFKDDLKKKKKRGKKK